jgi:hypothetical protein
MAFDRDIGVLRFIDWSERRDSNSRPPVPRLIFFLISFTRRPLTYSQGLGNRHLFFINIPVAPHRSSLKPPEKGAKVYYDDSLKGFGVRASQAGTRRSFWRRGKKRDRQTIGRYPPQISLVDARRAAQKVIGEGEGGKHQPPDLTTGDALDGFLTSHEAANKSGSTLIQPNNLQAQPTKRGLLLFPTPRWAVSVGGMSCGCRDRWPWSHPVNVGGIRRFSRRPRRVGPREGVGLCLPRRHIRRGRGRGRAGLDTSGQTQSGERQQQCRVAHIKLPFVR